MSRSYKHNNFAANTCMGYDSSEKRDKQRANRKLRSKSKQAIATCDNPEELQLPFLREVDEHFTWIKEGKSIVDPLKCDGIHGMHFTKEGKLKR